MASSNTTKKPPKKIQLADVLYRRVQAGDTEEFSEHLDEVVPADGTPISVVAYQPLGVFTVARRPD